MWNDSPMTEGSSYSFTIIGSDDTIYAGFIRDQIYPHYKILTHKHFGWQLQMETTEDIQTLEERFLKIYPSRSLAVGIHILLHIIAHI